MSAIISVAYPDAAIIITDGAAYDDDNVLVSIGRKVTCSTRAPFAVSTRGHHQVGRIFQQILCDAADTFGVDKVISSLPEMMKTFKASPKSAEIFAHGGETQIVVAAWSEVRGPIHFNFHAGSMFFAPESKSFAVNWPDPQSQAFVSGLDFDEGILSRVPPKKEFETGADFARRHGADILEAARAVPLAVEKGGKLGLAYIIGGHCDVTIVTAAGASTETVRVWEEDKVGQTIRPATNANATSPLAAMSRQQRRALEREMNKRRLATQV